MVSRRLVARILILAALSLLSVNGWAARGRDPYGGYVYPAGARQGTQVRVTVGGQNLQNAKEVYFTGAGLSASVIETVRPLGNKQIRDAGQHLRVLLRQRWAETLRPGMAVTPEKLAAELKALDPLPDHPWLRGLEKKSLTELEELRDTLQDPKRQPNAQIGEWAIIDITVASNAAPGHREMRVRTPTGMTNPLPFEVSRLPEVPEPARKGMTLATVTPPVAFNGQIMPGETDQFRLQCKRGQKLVVTTQARRLVPYLADAVPGWFQAVVVLRDAMGMEVAYADDYRYDPDPVLLVNVPEDGEYTLEIRDSIYRGREDFVYRMIVGEQPFITSLFPLGGPAGSPVTATVGGWNLPQTQVQLEAGPEGGRLRGLTLKTRDWTSNSRSYDVDTLPEALEAEPNDLVKQALVVTLPQIINGRIASTGDVDTVQFEGRAGDEFVAEVRARRLGSPLDALLRLTNAAGKPVALNDDHEDKESGLITDHADSYLTVRLPSNGRYYLQLSDTRRQGGDDYAYRLRLSQPRPNFALRVTPSSLNVQAMRTAPVTVYALRSEGFAGAIDLKLKGAPTGYVLSGGHIPAGRDKVALTLTVPADRLNQPVALQLEGQAQIAGATVTRPAIPAEDMMQAFAYWHLVPSQQFIVCGSGPGRWTPDFALSTPGTVRLVSGGTTQVQFKLSRALQNNLPLRPQLSNAPAGITLQESTVKADLLTLVLKADNISVGYSDNLIIECFSEFQPKRPDGKPAPKQRLSIGFLPALSFEVVKQ
ncbi:MAG: hypothetical protein ACYC63_17470 [Armatimonadota bacterium]